MCIQQFFVDKETLKVDQCPETSVSTLVVFPEQCAWRLMPVCGCLDTWCLLALSSYGVGYQQPQVPAKGMYTFEKNNAFVNFVYCFIVLNGVSQRLFIHFETLINYDP